jgi:protein-L-isoaspartate(D-aspartate) O-methyltransferase
MKMVPSCSTVRIESRELRKRIRHLSAGIRLTSFRLRYGRIAPQKAIRVVRTIPANMANGAGSGWRHARGYAAAKGFRIVHVSVSRLIVFTLGALLCGDLTAQDRFQVQRDRMVRETLAADGITNKSVLSAMRIVPRHEFVAGLHRGRAYEDTSLPIGSSQTISPPYIVGYMTQVLDPQAEDRVLEIGTGSGYQAAVLAEIVSDVYTIEIVPELARSATRRLQRLEYTNVHVREGDGYLGWPEEAPFDKIIVTCSPEQIPQPLTEQLREGGRMIIPVGERYQQAFVLLKKQDGELQQERLIPTLFVPMTGESESLRRVRPDPDRPQIVNGSFEEDENGDGKVDGWHYQRKSLIGDDEPMDGKRYIRFENDVPGDGSQMLQGTAINGLKIAGLRIRYWVRWDSVASGPAATDQAGLVVHFYDRNRKEIAASVFGNYRGSLGWQQARTDVTVPPRAREMILRIGLNGAVGTIDFDKMQMVPVPR